MVINLGPPSPGLRANMTQKRNGKEKRMFTIELRSKKDVKNVSLDGGGKVLIEGSIGTLVRARFLEDLIFEVTGSDGELRIDLAMRDLERAKDPEAQERGQGGDR
jgi:hypothetical protein